MSDMLHLKTIQLLSTPQAATRIGVRPATMRTWRSQGRGPKWVSAGRLVRYDIQDIDRWISEHRFQDTISARIAREKEMEAAR